MPVYVTVTFKVYHCVNGDRSLNGHVGFGTHSACQCIFDGDGIETGTETVRVNGP